jgi:hypothetical protein
MSKITTLALAAVLTLIGIGASLKASVSETAAGPRQVSAAQVSPSDLQRGIDTSKMQVQLMADQTFVFGDSQ